MQILLFATKSPFLFVLFFLHQCVPLCLFLGVNKGTIIFPIHIYSLGLPGSAKSESAGGTSHAHWLGGFRWVWPMGENGERLADKGKKNTAFPLHPLPQVGGISGGGKD